MNIQTGPLLFLAEADLEQQIIQLALRTVVTASIALIVLVIISAVIKDRVPQLKLPLFILIAIAMIGSTLILIGSTVYLNTKSESKGPVHWHSEIELWSCGAELDLRNPKGALSNKIGTSTYHEHNDKHIHLEGVVVRKSKDASLEKFMQVTGGYINQNALAIPLNKSQDEWFAKDTQTDGDKQDERNFSRATGDGEWITQGDDGAVLTLKNGGYCGSNVPVASEVQVFVYSYDKATKTYSQRKLERPGEYIMRPESGLGPPADCVIVEYDVPKLRTDKLCQQYGLKDEKRCVAFGVKEFSDELCNIRETTSGSL